MITNPQTHQRGLGKKKEGTQKKREKNAKLKYSAASEEKNKTGLVFMRIPKRETKGVRKTETDTEQETDHK